MPDTPENLCGGPGRCLPEAARILLAFDFGLKKIGVAIGNTITRQARALTLLRPVTRAQRLAQVDALLAQWQPDGIVVGLPLTLEGAEQPASRHSRRFARQIEARCRIPVILVDERGSSLEAQQILGSSAADDAVAAAVILQRYLDGTA